MYKKFCGWSASILNVRKLFFGERISLYNFSECVLFCFGLGLESSSKNIRKFFMENYTKLFLTWGSKIAFWNKRIFFWFSDLGLESAPGCPYICYSDSSTSVFLWIPWKYSTIKFFVNFKWFGQPKNWKKDLTI